MTNKEMAELEFAYEDFIYKLLYALPGFDEKLRIVRDFSYLAFDFGKVKKDYVDFDILIFHMTNAFNTFNVNPQKYEFVKALPALITSHVDMCAVNRGLTKFYISSLEHSIKVSEQRMYSASWCWFIEKFVGLLEINLPNNDEYTLTYYLSFPEMYEEMVLNLFTEEYPFYTCKTISTHTHPQVTIKVYSLDGVECLKKTIQKFYDKWNGCNSSVTKQDIAINKRAKELLASFKPLPLADLPLPERNS